MTKGGEGGQTRIDSKISATKCRTGNLIKVKTKKYTASGFFNPVSNKKEIVIKGNGPNVFYIMINDVPYIVHINIFQF
jgi:hypothetical protein